MSYTLMKETRFNSLVNLRCRDANTSDKYQHKHLWKKHLHCTAFACSLKTLFSCNWSTDTKVCLPFYYNCKFLFWRARVHPFQHFSSKSTWVIQELSETLDYSEWFVAVLRHILICSLGTCSMIRKWSTKFCSKSICLSPWHMGQLVIQLEDGNRLISSLHKWLEYWSFHPIIFTMWITDP